MPELLSDHDRLASLPSLPRDEGGPVFAEPWQAQAFALAVRRSAQGHFTWKEWAEALAAEWLERTRTLVRVPSKLKRLTAVVYPIRS